MPRTPTNLDAGNFMLDLSLLGPGIGAKTMPDSVSSWLANITADNVLYHSRRPAILPYASPLLATSHTLLNMPWHLLNLRDLDSSHLVVPMFEMLSFPRGSRNLPTHARLELQSNAVLQVYDVRLAFRAKFQGLRYLIYNYRVASFLVFTTLFYTISVTSMVLAWAVISTYLPSGEEPMAEPKRIKPEGSESNEQIKTEPSSRSGTKIKTEDDTESSGHGLSMSNISGAAAQLPTRRGPMPARHPGSAPQGDNGDDSLTRPIGPSEVADDEHEDDDPVEIRGRSIPGDSGIGTSMESEHTTSALVRRRSSRALSNVESLARITLDVRDTVHNSGHHSWELILLPHPHQLNRCWSPVPYLVPAGPSGDPARPSQWYGQVMERGLLDSITSHGS